MATNTDQLIRQRVETFVDDLTELIRDAAFASIREAMGEAPARPLARGGARRASAGRKKATRKAATRRGRGGKRIRRSMADLQQLCDELHSYIQQNPGERLENISAELGTTSKDLRRPVTLLLEAGRIRTEGQRRGTTYFAARGRATKKKATRKKAGRRKK